MRDLRRIQILAASSLFLVFSNSGWAQDNNTGTSPTPPVLKPSKPQPVGNDGADLSGPFKAQSGGLQSTIGQSQTSTPALPSAMPPDLEPPPRLEQDQARMRNVERQKQLETDTQRLLALATELKTDVDKSNKDMLSLDVIRKAEAIEKLAHSVKEKMKGS